MPAPYDLDDDSVVVVIGSGAGGGTVANELAQRGADVVCLEAGKPVPTSEIVNDEAVMFQKLSWLDKRIGSGVLPPPFPVWSGKAVGGTTMHWTGSCPRFQAHEFKPRTTYGAIEGTSLIDWPVDLGEMRPWYERAEKKMGVAGRNGLPFLPGANNFLVMQAAARKIGYEKVFTGHMAINPVARDGRPACQQIGFCKSGCAVDAKWTTANSEIPKAEGTGRFELRTGCMAVRINHDAAGRATGVVYVDADGVQHEQKARVVCLAANAIDTPRLLLMSESNRFPYGLANESGHVGRNYTHHMFGFVLGIMPGEVNYHRGTQNAGWVEDEKHNDPSRGFVGGYHMETVPFTPASLSRFLFPGQWGREVTEVLEKYPNFAGMLLVGEDLPSYENSVTLHPTERDAHGLPVPVVHYEDHANTTAMRKHGHEMGKRMYEALGAERVFLGTSLPATHNMGTCRMSDSREAGVTDRWGRCHDIENLFISDGSVFSSAGSENPTLTIVALAMRQADYLASRLKRGEL